MANGELEIWDADSNVIMGRVDPLIPINADSRRTIQNLAPERERLETIFSVRSAPEEGACSI